MHRAITLGTLLAFVAGMVGLPLDFAPAAPSADIEQAITAIADEPIDAELAEEMSAIMETAGGCRCNPLTRKSGRCCCAGRKKPAERSCCAKPAAEVAQTKPQAERRSCCSQNAPATAEPAEESDLLAWKSCACGMDSLLTIAVCTLPRVVSGPVQIEAGSMLSYVVGDVDLLLHDRYLLIDTPPPESSGAPCAHC